MDIQEIVNTLAFRLRREVIYTLLKTEFTKFRQPIPEKEQLAFEIKAIDALPCCTRLMKRLFEDAQAMRRERGFYPAPATVADLEWCVRNRAIGYSCTQRVRMGWLPKPEDDELRALPSFVELARIYRPMVLNGQKPLPPVERKAIISEATAIINETAANIKGA